VTLGRPLAASALSIRNISKAFGGAKALSDVSLDILPGEVHGLLGQNGSGKSTLIKILAGFHAPEAGGTMSVAGVECAFPMPAGRARQLGISFVHQHLGLLPSLTVLENMMVGEYAARRFSTIRWRRAKARVRDTFDRFGLSVDPDARVADLSQANRALVAIVRAFDEVTSSQAAGKGVLVLDEPTPFLPRVGVERLFALVRKIAAEGTAVVFVSHDIDEILEITDCASVLRDGRLVGSLATRESTADDFVRMIVGRKVDYFRSSQRDLSGRAVVAEIRNVGDSLLNGVSLRVQQGEVVGLTGLIGAGFDRLIALTYGSSRASRGQISIGGMTLPLAHMTPALALRSRIAFLPADRLGAAGVGALSVRDNITLPILPTGAGGLFLDWRSLEEVTRRLALVFEVRPNDPSLPFSALSGGNAQKALLAKWLQTEPALMLLDEPVQGVDVGARQRILSTIRSAAENGMAVVVASTDSEVLAQICDRVLVFARGSVVSELTGDRLTKASIAQECLMSTAGLPSIQSPGRQ
jgi:ribose transport system ATP-binding protein